MATDFTIRIDDLRGPEVAALLQHHLDSVVQYSPPESVHALDLDALRVPDITFWTVWDGEALAGCGALRELDSTHGEIKSMKTSPTQLRRGVARTLLKHILSVANERRYRRVSLETGSMEAFEPARALYRRFGFTECEPFASYVLDENSVCMTLPLDA